MTKPKTWTEKFEHWQDRCQEAFSYDREFAAYKTGIRHERARKKEVERKIAESIFDALEKTDPKWYLPRCRGNISKAWKQSAKEWKAWARTCEHRIDKAAKRELIITEIKDARIKNKQDMIEVLTDEIKRLEAQNRPWYVKLWGAMWGR